MKFLLSNQFNCCKIFFNLICFVKAVVDEFSTCLSRYTKFWKHSKSIDHSDFVFH